LPKFIRISNFLLFAVLIAVFALLPVSHTEAKNETILGGVYIDGHALGGKTKAEASEIISNYVSEIGGREITFNIIDGNYIVVTPDELGFTWSNPEIIDEAAALGQKGNIIKRYKAIKDLENSNIIFELKYSFDSAMITDIINEQCGGYNEPAIDAKMEIIDGEIVITDGQVGFEIDIFGSADLVIEYLDNDWDKENASIDLVVSVTEPRGSYAELSSLTDVLGTYTTSYSSSNSNRSANIANGTRLISGQLLYPGDEFNALSSVTPFEESNGYMLAGSFLRGELVDSLGGGICQVTTTLYNAVLLAELEITERHNHSMMVSYVEPSMDSAIAESTGMNLKFVNNSESPIFIFGDTSSDKKLTFSIYGKESRDNNREIIYQSEILETRQPEGEIIKQDAGQPIGFINIQSAYTGFKARLWKIEKVDGVEVGREQVNSSSYIAVPRTATVGTFTQNGAALEQIYAAIATNNIDHVRNVASYLQAHPEPPPAPVVSNDVYQPAEYYNEHE